jgi:hypothetical protein
MILSKIPFASLTRLSLPSNQVITLHTHRPRGINFSTSCKGRCLLLGEFNINNKRIRVGTVHLESLKPNATRRAEQLRLIFEALKPKHDEFDATLIMGVKKKKREGS